MASAESTAPTTKSMVDETDFVNFINEKLQRVMRDKALRDDTSNYVLRITHAELKNALHRQRMTDGIINATKKAFEHAGHEVVLEETSIKITAINVFAKKDHYSLNDLLLQHEIITIKESH